MVVDLVVEVGQRGALAGDVDQVGVAAVQQEAAVGEDLDDVGQGRAALDMAAAGEGAARSSCSRRTSAKQLPGRAGGGAPAGDLAGFGAAVDFQQRRLETGFGGAAPVASESGAVADSSRSTAGSSRPESQQRREVERRGDQQARLRHGGQRGDDVLRIEGLARPERRVAVQASSTVDSKPYMCCAGTVPTIACPATFRRLASARALRTSEPQDLR